MTLEEKLELLRKMGIVTFAVLQAFVAEKMSRLSGPEDEPFGTMLKLGERLAAAELELRDFSFIEEDKGNG